MTASENAIVCSNLCKRYKNAMALDGLNLTIARGSNFGLLGKNGAGKTTLLQCLMGQLGADTGTVSVLGTDPRELDAKVKARIGYVPQKIELYPWMKVQSLLDYVGSFYPSWNRALVGTLLAEWEVKPQVKVGTLSVGQLQKLAIIVAMGHEPELLLLDEPAASLDPMARRQFLKAMLDLCTRQERTVVFSTHITSDIERVADHVGIMKDGKALFCGELGELKDSVKKLHIRAPKTLPDTLALPGALTQEVRGSDALITVKDYSDALPAKISELYGAETQVVDMNLEDIFLSLNA